MWRWYTISSLRHDLIFFVAPFWYMALYASLVSTLPAYQPIIFMLAFIFVQETHFGSTWTFYLDPANRARFARRKWAFYYVPSLILMASALVTWTVGLAALLLIAFPLQVWHVTRQSTGFVNLYRSLGKDFSPTTKALENWALYACSLSFLTAALFNFLDGSSEVLDYRLAAFAPYARSLGTVSAPLLGILGLGTAGLVLSALSREVQRARREGTLNLTKTVVFVYSCILYAPYMLCERLEDAAMMGVGVHHVQYLGIVWLMNRNKYGTVRNHDAGTALLHMLSTNFPVRCVVLCGYGVAMFVFRSGGVDALGVHLSNWLFFIPVALNLIHFHVDAYLWRFSEPETRAAVLPYVLAPKAA
jgi:hypothetical protein